MRPYETVANIPAGALTELPTGEDEILGPAKVATYQAVRDLTTLGAMT